MKRGERESTPPRERDILLYLETFNIDLLWLVLPLIVKPLLSCVQLFKKFCPVLLCDEHLQRTADLVTHVVHIFLNCVFGITSLLFQQVLIVHVNLIEQKETQVSFLDLLPPPPPSPSTGYGTLLNTQGEHQNPCILTSFSLAAVMRVLVREDVFSSIGRSMCFTVGFFGFFASGCLPLS